jgi:hypothetical protein
LRSWVATTAVVTEGGGNDAGGESPASPTAQPVRTDKIAGKMRYVLVRIGFFSLSGDGTTR